MQLEAYDKTTRYLVHDYEIVGISQDELKTILEVDPEAEQYGAPVPPHVLPKILKFVNDPFQFNESCNYHVDFYSQ